MGMRENDARMLVSFFNMRAGTRFKFSSYGDQIEMLIAEDGSNIHEIRVAIKEYVDRLKENGAEITIRGFLYWYKYDRDQKSESKPQESVPAQTSSSPLDASLQLLSNTVATMVAQMKTQEIQDQVAGALKSQIDQYIFDTYGKIEKQVTLVSEFGKHTVPGIQHRKFETVLKFVANNEPVYLSGPAGSGKNVICKQVAEALGLEFYFTNAVTQEYKLTGFTDANGKFHESQFYKAFTKGGVFMLDEMDASIPEVLIILNAAIANRYFDFPAPIGKVDANPNFRVIAAGNTTGHGADTSYVGRNTLDAASLDRFAMIEIDYDERIELSVTNNNADLVAFCRSFRKSAEKAGLCITVSYRAMSRMAKMEQLLDRDEMIQTCLIKGLEKDDVSILKSNLECDNEYARTFKAIG